jgi:hypothetical protein
MIISEIESQIALDVEHVFKYDANKFGNPDKIDYELLAECVVERGNVQASEKVVENILRANEMFVEQLMRIEFDYDQNKQEQLEDQYLTKKQFGEI